MFDFSILHNKHLAYIYEYKDSESKILDSLSLL